MTFEQLLERIAGEPDRTAEQEIRVPTVELMNDLRGAKAMRLDELVADARHNTERRTFRTGHLLEPPVSLAELDQWRAAWPKHPLPNDLVALLGRANGIHLWADLDEGRAYEGLAPLAEWCLARQKMWGEDADPDLLADRFLALSYHTDGAAFVVLSSRFRHPLNLEESPLSCSTPSRVDTS